MIARSTRSFRIAMILDRWSPSRGGAEAAILELVDALVARGHRITFLCREGEVDPRWEVEEVSVTGWSRTSRERAFCRQASRRGRSDFFDVGLGFRHVCDADLYLPHGGMHRTAMERPLMAIRSPLRRAVKRWTRHRSRKHRFFLETEAELVGKGSRVIALSKLVERDFRSRYPTARIIPVFGGVDLDRFELRGEAPQRFDARSELGLMNRPGPWALFVAHNPSLKGLETILRAMSLPELSDLNLAWLGRGRSAFFLRLAHALGVADRFFVLGEVKDPSRVYGAMDLLVHPTYYDPCSRVVLEALASGLPVVTTRWNGASEIMTDDAGCVLDDPADTDALARAIASVCRQANRDEPMISRAARKTAEGASLQHHLDQLIHEIETAAEERRAKRTS